MSSRRQFLSAAAGVALGSALHAQDKGDRPKPADGVRVVNPQGRVPLSFIIDDSTVLVNLAHFGIPQFAEVFPDKYKQDWKKLPRDIPDAFVREFGEWCREHGVKGKYSVVPYPACVGWVDRQMPGWTRQEHADSLKLIRDFMTTDWDLHPEMVTHTVAVDTRTGRPFPNPTEKVMENWGFSVGKSADELTDYLAYALKVLKSAGLPCEGITTPGGFGNKVLPELARATLDSCRDVFRTEIPHYFRHLYTDDRSVAPRVELASGLSGKDPKCVVSIIGCTGDWTGGWDGLETPDADRFITADLKAGRLVQVIDKGEPACLVCHWPGLYHNGTKAGFAAFQTVVKRLNQKYDHLLWMKLSELSRYWAAKELTTLAVTPAGVTLSAPFATPRFTLEVTTTAETGVTHTAGDKKTELTVVKRTLDLKAGTWCREHGKVLACFDLPRGESALRLA